MQNRRVISLWFPRLAAQRVLRARHVDGPFAVVETQHNAQVLSSLCPQASAQGLSVGQSISDARALCPGLTTQENDPLAEAQFLTRLHRWAGKFTPWIAIHPPASLMMDISGCAHLFGGEAALAELITDDCERLRLSVQIGIADTVGAAWALARYAGQRMGPQYSGDDIDQEARATRSRAVKRRGWERGGVVKMPITNTQTSYISKTGQTFESIHKLPIAALRLPEGTVEKLSRLGLRKIADVSDLPRASLVRRFGADTVLRLDQALGAQPEPVCPADPPRNFATRLSLPDPIGLADDIKAAILRVTPPLCTKLRHAGMGARTLDLALYRTDQSVQLIQVSLARPAHDPDRILPLLTLHLPKIEPGFGIDMVRLEATVIEPVREQQHAGHAEALAAAKNRKGSDHADLMGRLGARIGLETLQILHFANSNLPEKTQINLPATYNKRGGEWAMPAIKRPIVMFSPEAISPIIDDRPPLEFKWRRRVFKTASYGGPERIAPEWWLDNPAWRTGTRDYWGVTTEAGVKLWLYQAHGGAQTGGWFCHGIFG
jgi:protein ImuB